MSLMTTSVPSMAIATGRQCVGYEARDYVAHAADRRAGDGVGQLGRDVVHVVALGARGGHDGGVRDGRAVVAADGARHAGGDADNAVRVGQREDLEVTMGMSMPKPPQLVPVEKAMKQPMRKTMAKQRLEALTEARSVVSTKTVAPRECGHSLEAPGKGEDVGWRGPWP